MKTTKRLFVYKCKLSLALLYLADMFINNFKTKLNVFVFTEEFQIEKVFTIPLEESFIILLARKHDSHLVSWAPIL